ncbi:unnamed protein product, partial [Meganyctiphanes norvegica]
VQWRTTWKEWSRMEFLECKICHIPYDEESHRPRNAPCGHEICSACLKALIKGNIFECPKCRQKSIVRAVEDLPVCFGLIDAIRAFKSIKNPLTNEIQSRELGASNDEVCKVHHKAIEHRCLKCQSWICNDCLDSHSTYTGCSMISSSKAVESMKEKHAKDIDMLLNIFEEDTNYLSSKVQELTDKRKELLEKAEEHGEEINEICKIIEQGKSEKEKLLESKIHLNETNSPYALTDRIEVLTQRKQSLHSWSIKNLGTDTPLGLPKALREEKDVYAEMVIKNEKRHAKLSQHDENICLHLLRTQTIEDNCISMPFDRLQNMIPDEASLVFFEFSLGGVVKGRVLVRLNENQPNIMENVVHIVTGQRGPSLHGIKLNYRDSNAIGVKKLAFKDIPVTPDSDNNERVTPKIGDIFGNFSKGYLQEFYFYVGVQPNTYSYPSAWCIIGNVEDGLDILVECHEKYSSGVEISDRGLVIEQE